MNCGAGFSLLFLSSDQPKNKMRFVDPRKTPFVAPRTRGELPHLQKPGAFYFVTFRLLDAVIPAPDRVQARGSQQIPDIFEWVAEYDPPLTLGSCILRDPNVALILQEAIQNGHEKTYINAAWCIMPNHVHAVFAPLPGHTLSKILQFWKGGSARRINQLLGKQGGLWERESFDHLIRNVQSLERFIHYTEQNPVISGYCGSASDWPHGSAGVGFNFS